MTPEKPQFDKNLGGSTEVPIEFNVMKFVTARAREISDLASSLDDPAKTSLIFQRLPRHMRRRVMSHNVKRLPRNVREAYKKQLLSMGSQPHRKTPSRKYRRRSANLLAEYNRRHRKHVWLETHIWHAKRFHMTQQWGYKIAHYPNDRSYRACYRAIANHCLIQDVSFLCCLEVVGPIHILLLGLNKHTSKCSGLTFAAKCFLDGTREGELMLYENDQYPKNAMGTVTFLWKPEICETGSRCIWIWVHPAFHQQVVNAFVITFEMEQVPNQSLSDVAFAVTSKLSYDHNEMICDSSHSSSKKQESRKISKNVEGVKLMNRNVPFERTPKYESKCGKVQMALLKDTLNRFRLTGPLSQAVLEEALQTTTFDEYKSPSLLKTKEMVNDDNKETCPITMDIGSIFDGLPEKDPSTVKESCASKTTVDGNSLAINESLAKAHNHYWQSLHGLPSPAELPPHMVLSLTVSDPRLQIPDKRKKAVPHAQGSQSDHKIFTEPPPACASPIWSSNIRDGVARAKLSTAEINSMRSNLVVPGILRTSEGPLNADSNVLLASSLESSSPFFTSMRVKIPLLLIQRPGSQYPSIKRVGLGCGWDMIVPAGWAMPFWLALVFRCAKPAGLREANAYALESGSCEFLAPDTKAGYEEENKKGKELRHQYFKLPPAKRPNYVKLGVACPFQLNWSCLLRDWAQPRRDSIASFDSSSQPSFYVLRDRKVLRKLDELFQTLRKAANKVKDFDPSHHKESLKLALLTVPDQELCLLPVKVEALLRGVTHNMSLICIPSSSDMSLFLSDSLTSDPVEEIHEDGLQSERQRARKAHRKLLVRLRRKRVRAKRCQELEESLDDAIITVKGTCKSKLKDKMLPTEEIVKNHKIKMERMWLPNLSSMDSVKKSGSRNTAGFVCAGDFSFSEARGCGVGYIALQSLPELFEVWLSHLGSHTIHKVKRESTIVLIRSPSNLMYRPAKLNIIHS